jgi:hypothetical protein
MSNKYMKYDSMQRLKISRGLVSEDHNIRGDDAHENQKGKC